MKRLILCLCLSGLALASSAAEKRLPNVVILFADDLGYADVGCFGARDIQTPHLDRLARDGMRFTNFYVAQAVCSSSRAALLTGCYPNRIGIMGALGPNSKIGISDDERTIAQLLKPLGYATGIVGKWHLGDAQKFLPLQHGFDEYFGLPYSNDMWPYQYNGQPRGDKHYPPLRLIDGNERVDEIKTLADQATLTERYTQRACAFINKHRAAPFFLYVPFSMPHTPIAASAAFKDQSKQGPYGDVIQEIDEAVGRILKTLADCRLEKDTLVVFTSDNGPWLCFGKHAGSAGSLREGKGTMWEGGCREPAIMRWPDAIPAGKSCDKIASTIDLLPTICAITGAPLPEHKIDGVNILPLLRGERDANPRKEFYYYYINELRAVRQGDWKLIFPHEYRSVVGMKPRDDGMPGPYGQGKAGWELYHLATDIGERHDVAGEHPDIVARLRALGEAHRTELTASRRPPGRIADEPLPTSPQPKTGG